MFEMDECLYWIEMAYERADDYIELSYTDRFFEAEDSENNKKNDKTEKDSTTMIGNAARALIKMIENVITSIRKWLNEKFSIKRINAIRKAIKDAGKENQSVKVVDSKKMNAAYDEVYDKAKKEAERIESEENNPEGAAGTKEDTDNFIKGLENLLNEKLKGLGEDAIDIGKAGSAWVTTLSCEAALRMAENDAAKAETYLAALEHDKELMGKLEKDLGKFQAQSFKAKIKDCTRKVSLHRFMVIIRGRQQRSDAEIISNLIDDVSKVITVGEDAKSTIVGTAKNWAKDKVKGTLTTHRSSDERISAARRSDLRRKLVTNPNTAKGIKGAVNAKGTYDRAKRSAQFTTGSHAERTKGNNLFQDLLDGIQ